MGLRLPNRAKTHGPPPFLPCPATLPGLAIGVILPETPGAREDEMAKGQLRSNKEAKKPKKEKPKVLATAGLNNQVAPAGKKK
jgi:hypothetical protein